jgi:hypothetical protein
MPYKYNEKYTRELLTEAVANSISIADVLRFLEIPMAGGTHAHISRKIKQFGIDTSHFGRVAPNKGKPSPWRLTPEQALVARAPGLTAAEAAPAASRPARERCTVCLRGVWHRGRVERQADSVTRGPYQRRLARQQEGEPSISLSELSLTNTDIRR